MTGPVRDCPSLWQGAERLGFSRLYVEGANAELYNHTAQVAIGGGKYMTLINTERVRRQRSGFNLIIPILDNLQTMQG